jgi:phospholipid/cholesterol/gamma-HCH transport system permease protein
VGFPYLLEKFYLRLLLPNLKFVGLLASNLFSIISFTIKGKVVVKDFIHHSVEFAYNVISPVIVVCVALGVVIGVQIGPEFSSRGLGSALGALSSLTMTRELGPVVGCLMIATQYGTGVAAELANMKITEQVDALKVFKIDPIYYLVVPRFLAMLVFTPLIIWLASLLGVLSTFIVVRLTEGIRFDSFASSIWTFMTIKEILFSLVKSAVFGVLILLIASTLGLGTEGGAKEVGRATTMTVILSFVTVILVDFLITSIYL